MLYGSTRSKVESDTAQRTVWAERAGDGGFFVPMKIPHFKRTEVLRMKNRTPEENIALVLNQFFQTELSGKDIQFALGREYYRIESMSQKILLGILWDNPDGSIDHIIRLLSRCVAAEIRQDPPGEWPRVAIRVALLFALVGVLEQQGVVNAIHPLDLAVPVGDFTWPMAGWYARKMGLPLGTLILCGNEHDGVRELLHRGLLRMDSAAISTVTPKYDDSVPAGLERYVYTILGREETGEFLRRKKQGGIYTINPEQKRLLSEGMYVCVNTSSRIMGMIPNIARTFGRVLCPYGAMVYTGVLDYQAITGRYHHVLMLWDDSPRCARGATAAAMGISEQELEKRLNQGKG